MSLIADAKALATKAHRGQLDKAGESYILHVSRVAATVASLGEEYEATAWLHDTLEDTSTTLEDLRGLLGMTQAVLDAVEAITRLKSDLYSEYIFKVSRNKIATAVKKADIKDHLSREKTLPDSMRKRYEKALIILEGRFDK